ncbi:hypothetical protein Purlil1_8497 [Purpureocillium lilacinum]|uniref:Actin-like ATPase domain-containing protein n=1 Tax=Purpureocillium lilacinum TaxID=33203 RepID=A0ABR0BT72_PURLI|nr:hypothetical protein Purlil1_8497 [Purpureocillium lilacinum]
MATLSDLSGLLHAIEDSIIVGIDFGTTYSGVAWTDSGDCENIRIVSNWSTSMRNCSNTEKVPTALRHDENGNVTGWGYGVPPRSQSVRWFKLLLLEEKDVPKHVRCSTQFRAAREYQFDHKLDPVDMAASFLKHLWEHSLNLITRELGKELVDKSRFHIVITVPAMWPLYAHGRMRQAAQKAGLLAEHQGRETRLNLVSEPEAAALAIVSSLCKKSTVGDTLVVCDAGGGTADLISYVIESVVPFEVKECVKGAGDLCGGVFLDEEFLKLVERKVGRVIFGKFNHHVKRKFLNDNWEHSIKPQFNGKQATWTVEDLPAVCQAPGRGQKRIRELEFSSSDISSVFDSVVSKIEELVMQQLAAIQAKYQKPAKYVVLVGGFGRSPYLHDRLREAVPTSTEIHQPTGHGPWTAICQGAVMYGRTVRNLLRPPPVAVKARVARASYGLRLIVTWDGAKHLARDKCFDKHLLEWRADNQMEWCVVEGQDLNETTTFKSGYFRTFDFTLKGKKLDLQRSTFYFTMAKPPPTRHDDCVKSLCTVSWNEPISINTLPTETNKIGISYHVLRYEIEMRCAGGIAEFAVIYQGKRVASHSVQVEYQ